MSQPNVVSVIYNRKAFILLSSYAPFGRDDMSSIPRQNVFMSSEYLKDGCLVVLGLTAL